MQGAVEDLGSTVRKRMVGVASHKVSRAHTQSADILPIADRKDGAAETSTALKRPKSVERPQSISTLKRAIDLAIAIPVLVFLFPIMVALAVAIRLQDGGPALYRQPRLGQGGKTFTCFKFRTMVMDADARLESLLARDPAAAEEWRRDHKLRKDPRVLGAVGRFLRVTSLDELPQLFNIIRGEMSVVGPRPIVSAEVPRYHSLYRYYTAVRPGVTGLWQVSGRNNISYDKRVCLDAAYARKWCLALDLWILWRTIPAVIFRRGAY